MERRPVPLDHVSNNRQESISLVAYQVRAQSSSGVAVRMRRPHVKETSVMYARTAKGRSIFREWSNASSASTFRLEPGIGAFAETRPRAPGKSQLKRRRVSFLPPSSSPSISPCRFLQVPTKTDRQSPQIKKRD